MRAEPSTASFVSAIESPNLNSEELSEITEALGIHAAEKINLIAIDARLKKLYAEGKYEVLFLEMTQKGKENILVIRGSRLKKIKAISFEGLDSDLTEEFKKDPEVRESRNVGSKYLSGVRARIEGMLEQRGYFFSKVEMEQKENKEGIELIVKVEKNEPTRIRKISFKGLSEALESEIRDFISFSVKDVFNKAELEKTSEAINRYFRQNQYPTTRIDDTTLVFSQDKLHVDVIFLIKQGDKYQFQFVGNTIYPEVILREFLTEEVLSQADAANKVVGLIEAKYRAAGYHFCQVKIENRGTPSEKRNVIYFRVDEGKKVRIDGINFNGAEKVKQSLLEKWFYEEAPGVLARGVYWEAGLQELTQKLQTRMRKEGFLSATVSNARSVFSDDRLGAELIFEVLPGQRTYIHDVNLSGIQKLDRQEVVKSLGILDSQTFNPDKAEEIKKNIQKLYFKEGFADVQIKGDARNGENYELSPDQKQADVKLFITEGAQYFVGEITIEGNKNTDPDVIEHEMQLKTGDKYDPQKLRASEDEVSALGLFSRVEIVPSTSQRGTNIKDLRVIVLETRRGFGEVGLGAAYEDPRFRMRTFLGLAYKNLFRRNQTATVRSEVDLPFSDGYQLIPFIEYSTVLGYRMPYPLSLPFIFTSQAGLDSFETASTPNNKTATVQRRSKIEGKIERKISSHFTALYRIYHYEHTKTEDILIKKDRPDEPESELLEEADIGSTGPGVIFDFRDDPFNPTKGSFHSADFELASKTLLSQSDFYMANVRNSFYLPLFNGWGFTLFLGGAFAESTTPDGVLPKARLINDLALGGQGSIRGYPLRTFFPKDSEGNVLPCSATANYNTRLELTIPLYTNISLAVFLDSGQLYYRKHGEVWTTEPRYDGMGIGFRYKTPIGPVVFDMAEGLTAPGKVVKFLFTIGTF